MLRPLVPKDDPAIAVHDIDPGLQGIENGAKDLRIL
jgi:hypothetical protein